MSSPDSGTAPDPAPLPPDPRRARDEPTDPGRAQPYESLYRDPTRAAERGHRTTARHFEPSLTPPEGADEQLDTFGWLYRPPDNASPAADRTVDPSPGPAVEAAEPPVAVVEDPPNAGHASHDEPDEPERSRRGRLLVLLILLVALAGAGLAMAYAIGLGPAGDDAGAPVAAGAGPTSPMARATTADPRATAGNGAVPYAGATTPVLVGKAAADCQAPPSTDGAGRTVRYEPGLVADGDPTTAWRCPGSGHGRSLLLSFPRDTRIAEVGLINGYAKKDPKNGVDRYAEYRRISEVTWTFANGASFTQHLADRVESQQTLRIPIQTTDQVRLTITKSSAPGQHDAVLVSEVGLAAPAVSE